MAHVRLNESLQYLLSPAVDSGASERPPATHQAAQGSTSLTMKYLQRRRRWIRAQKFWAWLRAKREQEYLDAASESPSESSPRSPAAVVKETSRS